MPSQAQADKRGQSRVLVLPPTVRDAEAIKKVLAAVAIDCEIYRNVAELCYVATSGAVL